MIFALLGVPGPTGGHGHKTREMMANNLTCQLTLGAKELNELKTFQHVTTESTVALFTTSFS